MALYRKYRPQKFADIIGQDHIKKVLTNALMQDKIGHAYLFSGPRGSGKTTTARLLAKSLNCQTRLRFETRDLSEKKINLQSPISNSKLDFEPCNECISCLEVTGDRSMDVIEIDAASNRGIDEIRELRDKVRFAPTSGRYKVYIIDEVHMLTKEAFNALLKTLEEPPKHAIFIMATTELHKVPDTILSRTQQFDFKRASIKELLDNLEKVSKSEKLNIDSDALKTIAGASEGSFRDAVSILDQVSSISESIISTKHVQDVLGIVPEEIVNQFIDFIQNDQATEAIDLISKIYEEGYDLGQFNQTAIEQLRKKMITSGDYNLSKMIKRFVQVGLDLKTAVLPQVPLELAVIEVSNQLPVTSNKEEDNKVTVKEQSQKSEVKSEEKKIITKSEMPTAKLEIDGLKANDEQQMANSQQPVAKSKEPVNDLKSQTCLDDRRVSNSDLGSRWAEVVEVLAVSNHSLGILLKDANALEIKNNKLILGVKFKFYAERIMASDKYAILTEEVEKVFGEKLGVECVVEDNSKFETQNSKLEDNTEINNNLITDALEVFGE